VPIVDGLTSIDSRGRYPVYRNYVKAVCGLL